MPLRNDSPSLRRLSPTSLLRFAFLNLGRHRLRATVNCVGIAIAVAALVFFLAFYRGTYEGIMFSSVIDYATSQGQFMSLGFDDDDPDTWLDGEGLVDEELLSGGGLLQAAMPDGKSRPPLVGPRLMSPAFAGDGSRKAPVTLAGIDFPKEREILSIDERIEEGIFAPEGVVIGKKLAKTLDLGLGDEIRIQATTTDGSPNLDYWKIAGIFSTGYPPMDRGMVLMDLSQAQVFLGAEGKVNKGYCRVAWGVDSVARDAGIASLETPNESRRFADLGIMFKSWKNYAKAIVNDAKADGSFYVIFLAILLFLSLSTMAGTMRVTVFERKREIGMLRASGWLREEIAQLFLFEALAIGLAGGLAGAMIGGGASLALQANPIGFGGSMASLDIPSFSLTCDLQTRDLLVAIIAGFLTALLAGILPALSAARMPILSALSER